MVRQFGLERVEAGENLLSVRVPDRHRGPPRRPGRRWRSGEIKPMPPPVRFRSLRPDAEDGGMVPGASTGRT